MLVIGGRTNNVLDNVPLDIYDCESSAWTRLSSVQRFRHAAWLIDNMLYVYGGFEESPDIPTESVARFDLGKQLQLFEQQTNVLNQSNVSDSRSSPFGTKFDLMRGISNNSENPGNVSFIQEAHHNKQHKKPTTAAFGRSKEVRMSEHVWVVTPHNNLKDGRDVIRNVSIGNLPEESRKLTPGYNHNPNARSLYYESVYNPFLMSLMKPAKFCPLIPEGKFHFKAEQIHKLIDECINLFDNREEVSTVLRLRIPIKIFGSLHGQYGDLMRLFDHWGSPTDDGDIEGFDYLFLGNYIDRGRCNLEVLCLLFSLKLKYPDQFHLLRGSHEDIKINRNFGFGEECATRLGENIDDPNSVFQRFNRLFEYLPLAAVIQDKILCVHSGIGNTLGSIQELEMINRPIEVTQDSFQRDHQLLWDLLWSDPVQTGDILQETKWAMT